MTIKKDSRKINEEIKERVAKNRNKNKIIELSFGITTCRAFK